MVTTGGNCWIWVSDVPFWDLVVGSANLGVLGISGVSGKWEIKDRK